jgi:hypothetical protein
MVSQKLRAEKERQEAQVAAAQAAKAKGAGISMADSRAQNEGVTAQEPAPEHTQVLAATTSHLSDTSAKAGKESRAGEAGASCDDTACVQTGGLSQGEEPQPPPPPTLSSEARAEILAVAHEPSGSATDLTLKTGSMDLVVDKVGPGTGGGRHLSSDGDRYHVQLWTALELDAVT